MNESEKQFSFTRAASSRGGRAQKQILISLSAAIGLLGDLAMYAQPAHPPRVCTIIVSATGDPSPLPPLEICALPGNRRVALTTMWDDGPVSTFPGGGDLRMARTLATNGWKASFGWHLLSDALPDTADVLGTGMEICSHTATHPLLSTRTANAIFWELLTSRIYLSVLTQRPVVSYADAFLSHDRIIDREIESAGYLFGRGGSGSFSIFDMSRRLKAPSTWIAYTGTNACSLALQALYDSGIEGQVQSFWGHAYPPEFSEDFYAQVIPFVSEFANRPDTWYATAAEVGSQMLLRNAAVLGAPAIDGNTVRYQLQIGPLPRDTLLLPLTLRLRGDSSQLGQVASVTLDGQPVATRMANGALVFDVMPFLDDVYAGTISAELTNSARLVVQQTIHWLPQVPAPELGAAWSWLETNGSYSVTVCVTNSRDATLDLLSLQLLTSSIWMVSNQDNVPLMLPPTAGFETHFTVSPNRNENVGGWTAFAARLDYSINGTPKTHYLFRDALLPLTPGFAHAAPGPNCQIAGPISTSASGLSSILAEADGKWSALPYDPSDRPSMINLVPVYYPTNLLVPGPRVITSYLTTTNATQGILYLSQQYLLAGFRFWINETELVLNGGSYSLSLKQGVNRFVAVCDTVTGVEPVYTWPIPIISFEPAFLQMDGLTPLAGLSFNVRSPVPELCLRVSSGSGPWSLTWNTVPGGIYRVEFATDLAAPNWATFGQEQVAASDSLTLPFTPPAPSQGFFRVIWLNQ